MKVEYSYYDGQPSLVIKGADFKQALSDPEERDLLQIAVQGFGAQFEVDTFFEPEVNDAILHWLDKTGHVIYSLQERWTGRHCSDAWCEIHVLNGVKSIIVMGYDERDRRHWLNDGRRQGDE